MKNRVDIVSGPGRMDFVYALPYYGHKQGPAREFCFIVREAGDNSGEKIDIFLTITRVERDREAEEWLFEGQDGKWTYKGRFSTKDRAGWIEIRGRNFPK